MILPDEYMEDPDVQAAIKALLAAIKASLAARDNSLKTLVMLVHADRGKSAALLDGCDCLGCKMAIAEGFARLITHHGGGIPDLMPGKGPVRSVH